MSTKKRIRPGALEANQDGTAIVVHFTTEITHLDEDGMPQKVEKLPEKREVPIGRDLHNLQAHELCAVAQEIIAKCKYITASKAQQVEQLLAKLQNSTNGHSQAYPSGGGNTTITINGIVNAHGVVASKGRRISQGNGTAAERGATAASPPEPTHYPVQPPASHEQVCRQIAALLPPAEFSRIEDYADELYEEKNELKAHGAQCLLKLSTEVQHLEALAEHSTILGVLSRELRENAKRSHELAVAIAGCFLCLSHFTEFHQALIRHQCGDVTMRVVEYEGKRRTVLKKEIAQSRGRMAAKGEKASREDVVHMEREERRYKQALHRQDRLLHVCHMVLRNLAEDVGIERKIASRKVCHYLVQLLPRSGEELLIGTMGFLQKLVIVEENKEYLVSAEVLSRLAVLANHPCTDVALWALRLCYNVSFDPKARALFTSQTNLTGSLVAALGRAPLRKTALKVLYHQSMEHSFRIALPSQSPECIAAAMQLMVHFPEPKVDAETASVCVNLATDEVAAAALLKTGLFPHVVGRAARTCDPLLFKVIRHTASHPRVLPQLLTTMREGSSRGDQWLHDIVRLAVRSPDSPELLVEVVGTLANLTCSSRKHRCELPWAELCETGLLELLHRLLMTGFSEDDVLLECVMLSGIVALDGECSPLIAASKVPFVLQNLLTEKKEDDEIVLQLVYTFRCLLFQEETRDAVMQETDALERMVDLLKEETSRSKTPAAARKVRHAAGELLEWIHEAELSRGDDEDSSVYTSRWIERIKALRFALHNEEWCRDCLTGGGGANGVANGAAAGGSAAHGSRLAVTSSDASPGHSDAIARKTSYMRSWADMTSIEDRCWENSSGGSSGDDPHGGEDDDDFTSENGEYDDEDNTTSLD